MPQSLQEWLTHLESLHPKTIALGLERVAKSDSGFSLRPAFPIIVVGGTNGKGSVCAMLEAMLHAAAIASAATPRRICLSITNVCVSASSLSAMPSCAHHLSKSRRSGGDHVRGDIALTYFEFGTLGCDAVFYFPRG